MINMLTLNGQVANVLEVPEGQKKDGSQYGGYHQVQLMCQESLKNGETRLNLFTLSTDDPEQFKKYKGKTISAPVGVFARGGNLHFYLQKSATIQVVGQAQ